MKNFRLLFLIIMMLSLGAFGVRAYGAYMASAALERPDQSGGNLSDQILPGLFRTSTFTETIHYADGTNPRYNGTPSARGLTSGGRYDYRYDGLNRLVGADYTAPESTPDADFSTEYTYDMLSRPLTIRRRGVVDIDGTTEIFGQLDDLTLSYGGATLSRVQSNITDGTGREFYGRTGWANGTYMTGAVLKYNSAGRLIMDSSRMISLIAYNSIGLPVCYSRSPSTTDNAPRQERIYDATGRKLRQTDYQFIRGQVSPVTDRRYVESFTFNTDTLERTDFSGGYFDGAGNAHFLFTDWQGNVNLAVSDGGIVEQHTGYYPYGEPWREPSGQHARLFAGKERVAGLPEGEYDFGPRGYRSTFLLWDSPDIKATDYPQWSPWLYCGANPIKYIDPDGNRLRISDNFEGAVSNIAQIAATNAGRKIVNNLIGSKHIFTLNSTFFTTSSRYNSYTRDIDYVKNPWFSEMPLDGGYLSSMTVMGHEMMHAFDHSIGLYDVSTADMVKNITEPRAVSFANYLRMAYSLEPLRTKYKGIRAPSEAFSSIPNTDKISNFSLLGKSKDGKSFGFSYTKTEIKMMSSSGSLNIFHKADVVSSLEFMVVTLDKNNNVTFQTYQNFEDYQKATDSW